VHCFALGPIKLLRQPWSTTCKLLLTKDCMNIDTNKLNKEKRDEILKTVY
jgi:hypothetical protein